MSNPKLIGITGGIGSGKSTVCKIFETLGCKSYYADDQAKLLMQTDPQLIGQVKVLFGEKAYQGSKIDRKHIANLAFKDVELLQKLNEAVHPAVKRDFKKWVDKNSNEKLLLKEAALLIETGSYKELDCLILVQADEEIRIERVLKRDPHRSKDNIQKIISRQLPEEKKALLVDFVIDNSGKKSVIEQVITIYDKLIIA